MLGAFARHEAEISLPWAAELPMGHVVINNMIFILLMMHKTMPGLLLYHSVPLEKIITFSFSPLGLLILEVAVVSCVGVCSVRCGGHILIILPFPFFNLFCWLLFTVVAVSLK